MGEDRTTCLLSRCLAWLQTHGLRFVVVGDCRGLPDSVKGDVDLVMSSASLAEFRDRIFELAEECQCRLVQSLQHEICAYYLVLVDDRDPNAPYLRLDVCSDYRRNGRLLLREDYLLGERGGAPCRHSYSHLPVPNDSAAFLYYWLKKVEKGLVDDDAFGYLRLLWLRSATDILRCVSLRVDFAMAAHVQMVMECDDVTQMRERLPLMKAALRRRFRRSVACLLAESIRRMVRLCRPTGLTVVLVGDDSDRVEAVAEHALRRLKPAFRKVRRIAFRPWLAQRAVELRPPRNRPLLGTLLAGTWFGIAEVHRLLADWLAWLHLYLTDIARSSLVFCVRSAAPASFREPQTRTDVPGRFSRWMAWLTPRPDVVLVLSSGHAFFPACQDREAPPRPHPSPRSGPTAWSRCSFGLDASQTVEQIAQCIETTLLDSMEQRMRQRLRGGFTKR